MTLPFPPPLKVKSLTGEPAKISQGYPGDAGFDLYCSEDTLVPPIHGDANGRRGFADVPLGLAVELPEGWWGLLTGRSSTIRTEGLLVTNGIIDNGYRGPLFAGVQNTRQYEVLVRKDQRIAQLILMLSYPGGAVEVDELSPTLRGQAGFGSTGR